MRSRLSSPSSIALGLLLGASACGHPASTADADLRAVNALRAQLQGAENAGLTDAFMALCAQDVIVMPPNSDAIVGAAAVATFVGGAFRDFTVSEQYHSAEAVVAGDWAFDRGTYDQTLTRRAGGAAITEHGKYLWLLHRGANGGWKYARTTWNANAAPAAP
jgi:ketosteroid isomerase-like protein